jgi:hypothetical protein
MSRLITMLIIAADLRHEQWPAKVWLGAEEGSNTEHHGPTFIVNRVSRNAKNHHVMLTCNHSADLGFIFGTLILQN